MQESLGIDENNVIRVTFHPEYTYGDFVAKLLPMTVRHARASEAEDTKSSSIEYSVHPGPLIKALAKAINSPNQNFLLVIDEINRGNCAAIFGDFFQLLDRDSNGCSQYGVQIADLTFAAIMNFLGWQSNGKKEWTNAKNQSWLDNGASLSDSIPVTDKNKELFHQRNMRLPKNLSIVGTMNTSDESVYYMDTAFKRRWDFEYMNWSGDGDQSPALENQKNATITYGSKFTTWFEFLKRLNTFIAEKSRDTKIDDKQVGLWFLKSKDLTGSASTCGPESALFLPSAVEFKNVLESLLLYSKSIDWECVLRPYFEGSKDIGYIALPGGNINIHSISHLVLDIISYLENKYKTRSMDLKFLKHTKIEVKKFLYKKCPMINEYQVVLDAFYTGITKIITNKRFRYVPQVGVANGEKYPTSESVVLSFIFILDIINFHYQSPFIDDSLFIKNNLIKNKLMFFLWDNVFSRDRKPLEELLGTGNKLRTFGHFSDKSDDFIAAIMELSTESD